MPPVAARRCFPAVLGCQRLSGWSCRACCRVLRRLGGRRAVSPRAAGRGAPIARRYRCRAPRNTTDMQRDHSLSRAMRRLLSEHSGMPD